ncbi:hypothetical protein CNMCM5623_005921 [Aspergillus felis]|uniref:cAMP-mediated signaling protein Sok1 n=1 Tax=Aspergillus felis TaxID=1287682 RepID=A0A8H6VB84_9EURO|nr:hypothetical protein CNMCM5623_005921 [Aspergillus felis]KAF7184840.1 hypothetical protein CNMCM7691_006839 [Aspergillus felis]
MDLQKTKEARRNAPGKEEEGTGCPLEAYNGSGHSIDSLENDSLDHRNETKRKNSGKNSASTEQPCSATPPTPPSPSSEAMKIPKALDLSAKQHKLLQEAKQYPPVTKRTLSELDLPCIMSNINLRMDANFDRDLHFKPDLDGEKGRRKRKEAGDYWEAMAAEIAIYAFCANQNEDATDDGQQDDLPQTFEPRLPAMFETLQDVLKTLVPERDHPAVTQNLDVSLLMQQVRKGVLDMVGIANWLARLLKTHCAPMRDEWADRMVEQISSGSESQDSMEIVRGLQTLFAILEAMKLDVANHQIRAFRVLLIEDTVPFLQEYFRNVREQELRNLGKSAQNDSFVPISLLFHGLTDILLQFHGPKGFPETFVFDSDRLWQLRSGLQNLITLDICWFIFESYVHTQKRYLSAPAQTYASFRSRIGSLMEENEDCRRGSPRWLKNVRGIALEIARFACAACTGDSMVSDAVIAPIEATLEWHLSNESSELFQYFRNALRQKLLVSTFAFAKKYLNMSPLAICESQRSYSHSPLPQHYDIERISMRLAHIGVLHWRVWAPILYVRESLSPTDVASSLPAVE